MLITPKWLKLRTLSLTHVFPGTIRTYSSNIFPKGGVARVTWPLNRTRHHASILCSTGVMPLWIFGQDGGRPSCCLLSLILLWPKSDITGRFGLSMATGTPNLVKIFEMADEIWRFSYFSEWRPVAILDYVIGQKWCYGTLRTVHVYHHAKFVYNSSICGRVIAIFRFSKWLSAAILDFGVFQKLHHVTLRTDHGH